MTNLQQNQALAEIAPSATSTAQDLATENAITTGKTGELAFNDWFDRLSRTYGIDPNPDAPGQIYDYRAAHAKGANLDAEGRLPDQFLKEGKRHEDRDIIAQTYRQAYNMAEGALYERLVPKDRTKPIELAMIDRDPSMPIVRDAAGKWGTVDVSDFRFNELVKGFMLRNPIVSSVRNRIEANLARRNVNYDSLPGEKKFGALVGALLPEWALNRDEHRSSVFFGGDGNKTYKTTDIDTGALIEKRFTPSSWIVDHFDLLTDKQQEDAFMGRFQGIQSEGEMLAKLGTMEERRTAEEAMALAPWYVSLPVGIGLSLTTDPIAVGTGALGGAALRVSRIATLLRQGLSVTEIAEKLGIPESVVISSKVPTLIRAGRVVAINTEPFAKTISGTTRVIPTEVAAKTLAGGSSGFGTIGFVAADGVVAMSLYELASQPTLEGTQQPGELMNNLAFGVVLNGITASVGHALGYLGKVRVRNVAGQDRGVGLYETMPDLATTAGDVHQADEVVSDIDPVDVRAHSTDAGTTHPDQTFLESLREVHDKEAPRQGETRSAPPPVVNYDHPKTFAQQFDPPRKIEYEKPDGNTDRLTIIKYSKDHSLAAVRRENGSLEWVPVSELNLHPRDITPLPGLAQFLSESEILANDPALADQVRGIDDKAPDFEPSDAMRQYQESVPDEVLVKIPTVDPFEETKMIIGETGPVAAAIARPFAWLSRVSAADMRFLSSRSGPVRFASRFFFEYAPGLSTVGIRNGNHKYGGRPPWERIRRDWFDFTSVYRHNMERAARQIYQRTEDGKPTTLNKVLSSSMTLDEMSPIHAGSYINRRFEMAHEVIRIMADDPIRQKAMDVYNSMPIYAKDVILSVAEDLDIDIPELLDFVDKGRGIDTPPDTAQQELRHKIVNSLFVVRFRSGVKLDELTKVVRILQGRNAGEGSIYEVLKPYYAEDQRIFRVDSEVNEIEENPDQVAKKMANHFNLNHFGNIDRATARRLVQSANKFIMTEDGLGTVPVVNFHFADFEGASQRAMRAELVWEAVATLRDIETQANKIGAEYPILASKKDYEAAKPFWMDDIRYDDRLGRKIIKEFEQRWEKFINYNNLWVTDDRFGNAQMTRGQANGARKHAGDFKRIISQLSGLENDTMSPNMLTASRVIRNMTVGTLLTQSGVMVTTELAKTMLTIAVSKHSGSVLRALKTALGRFEGSNDVTLKAYVRRNPAAPAILRHFTNNLQGLMGSIKQRAGEGREMRGLSQQEATSMVVNLSSTLAKFTGVVGGLDLMTNLVKSMATLAVMSEYQGYTPFVIKLLDEFGSDFSTPEFEARMKEYGLSRSVIDNMRSHLSDDEIRLLGEVIGQNDLEKLGEYMLLPATRLIDPPPSAPPVVPTEEPPIPGAGGSDVRTTPEPPSYAPPEPGEEAPDPLINPEPIPEPPTGSKQVAQIERYGVHPEIADRLNRAAKMVTGSPQDHEALMTVTSHIFSNNPSLVARLKFKFPNGEVAPTSPLGEFKIIGAGQAVIRLFQGAEVGTYIHEIGHYLAVLLDDSDTQLLIDELRKLNKDFVTTDASGLSMITRAGWEQAAETAEEVLRSKTPPKTVSRRLRMLFSRLRDMLARIFNSVRSLPNVNISEEMNELWSRIMGGEYFRETSDAEIKRRLQRARSWMKRMDEEPQTPPMPANADPVEWGIKHPTIGMQIDPVSKARRFALVIDRKAYFGDGTSLPLTEVSAGDHGFQILTETEIDDYSGWAHSNSQGKTAKRGRDINRLKDSAREIYDRAESRSEKIAKIYGIDSLSALKVGDIVDYEETGKRYKIIDLSDNSTEGRNGFTLQNIDDEKDKVFVSPKKAKIKMLLVDSVDAPSPQLKADTIGDSLDNADANGYGLTDISTLKVGDLVELSDHAETNKQFKVARIYDNNGGWSLENIDPEANETTFLTADEVRHHVRVLSSGEDSVPHGNGAIELSTVHNNWSDENTANPIPNGSPVVLQAFHAWGRNDAGSVYGPNTDGEPLLGKGWYGAPDVRSAQAFGPNVEQIEIRLEKPITIETMAQWDTIASVPLSIENMPIIRADFRRAIKERHADGVILNFPEHTDFDRDGISIKRIRRFIGGSQVYRPGMVPKPPIEQVGHHEASLAADHAEAAEAITDELQKGITSGDIIESPVSDTETGYEAATPKGEKVIDALHGELNLIESDAIERVQESNGRIVDVEEGDVVVNTNTGFHYEVRVLGRGKKNQNVRMYSIDGRGGDKGFFIDTTKESLRSNYTRVGELQAFLKDKNPKPVKYKVKALPDYRIPKMFEEVSKKNMEKYPNALHGFRSGKGNMVIFGPQVVFVRDLIDPRMELPPNPDLQWAMAVDPEDSEALLKALTEVYGGRALIATIDNGALETIVVDKNNPPTKELGPIVIKSVRTGKTVKTIDTSDGVEAAMPKLPPKPIVPDPEEMELEEVVEIVSRFDPAYMKSGSPKWEIFISRFGSNAGKGLNRFETMMNWGLLVEQAEVAKRRGILGKKVDEAAKAMGMKPRKIRQSILQQRLMIQFNRVEPGMEIRLRPNDGPYPDELEINQFQSVDEAMKRYANERKDVMKVSIGSEPMKVGVIGKRTLADDPSIIVRTDEGAILEIPIDILGKNDDPLDMIGEQVPFDVLDNAGQQRFPFAQRLNTHYTKIPETIREPAITNLGMNPALLDPQTGQMWIMRGEKSWDMSRLPREFLTLDEGGNPLNYNSNRIDAGFEDDGMFYTAEEAQALITSDLGEETAPEPKQAPPASPKLGTVPESAPPSIKGLARIDAKNGQLTTDVLDTYQQIVLKMRKYIRSFAELDKKHGDWNSFDPVELEQKAVQFVSSDLPDDADYTDYLRKKDALQQLAKKMVEEEGRRAGFDSATITKEEPSNGQESQKVGQDGDQGGDQPTQPERQGGSMERPSGETPTRVPTETDKGTQSTSSAPGDGAIDAGKGETGAGGAVRQGGRSTGSAGDSATGTSTASGERNGGAGAVSKGDGQGHGTGSGESIGELSTTESEKPPETNSNVANFTLTDPSYQASGGSITKLQANIDALQTLESLRRSKQPATLDEQKVLAKYVGWGQFPQVFAYGSEKYRTYKPTIKALLTEEEWDSAKRSTTNAHYTSGEMVQAMWRIAEILGYKSGRMLEPALGSGNFIGYMPDRLRRVSRIIGIEKEPVSAEIAQHLYPGNNVSIRAQGFEDLKLPDDFFDLAISNVPFGNFAVYDKPYTKQGLSRPIHDYFITKMLDKVRPNGLVMAITSMFTLDKYDPKFREAFHKRADLVAAFRLPSGTFGANAGTQVVTDLLIFRKRAADEEPGGESFLDIDAIPNPDGGGEIPINEYFINHPDHALGRVDMRGTMYSMGQPNLSLTDDFDELLENAINSLPRDIMKPRPKSEAFDTEKVIEADREGKEGALLIHDGRIVRKQGDTVIDVHDDYTPKNQQAVMGAIELRDTMRDLMARMAKVGDEEGVQQARALLNKKYDEYVNKHGLLNSRKFRNLFDTDPDFPLLLALEKYDANTKRVTGKAAIFRTNTIRPIQRAISAGTETEAVSIVLNEMGRLDLDRISELLGEQDHDIIINRLVDTGLAFRNPVDPDDVIFRDLYLSGNVKQALQTARTAAETDNRYLPNVKALEAIIPKDIEIGDIGVRLGVPWVEPDDYRDFAAQLLGGRRSDFVIGYLENTGRWVVRYRSTRSSVAMSNEAKEIYGTPRANFIEVMQKAMSQQAFQLRIKFGADKGKADVGASIEANAKITLIQDEFKKWLWDDNERAIRLHRRYNDDFNNMVNPKWDGSHLTFPGSSPAITLRPHQKDAVWRTILNGRALYAHDVGAGKTFTMIAAAMERKRMQLSNKPAIAVQKSTLAGFVEKAKELYPAAKIFSVDKFDAKRRKKLTSQIATENWDIVILTHDQLGLIPMSKKVQEEFLTNELRELEEILIQARELDGSSKKKGSRFVKEIEKKKENLEARIQAILDTPKDNAVTFEETGIDLLFVDESHNFKSLPVYTTMQRVKGIPTASSNRATTMAMRTKWLMNRNGNQEGVVFATGTPITNSLAELYNLQRYLQPDEMAQRGILSFDAWARTFTESKTDFEANTRGEIAKVTRLSAFVNIPELRSMVGGVLDSVRLESVSAVSRPNRHDHAIEIPMTDDQHQYMQMIQSRARNLDPRNRKEDNHLKISTDARKSSIDMRLIGAEYEDVPNSKLNKAVQTVLQVHNDNPGKIQLIFSEMGVHPNDWGFSVYDDIKNKLIAGGIPADKVIVFKGGMTERAKRIAIERLYAGEALIGIGSTEVLGTGVNVQQHLLQVHHLDALWNPAATEQRNGRIWREGNLNKDIDINTYLSMSRTGTLSFDTYMYGLNQAKANFIKQFRDGDVTVRRFENEDGNSLNAAQLSAIASGNPDLMKRLQLTDKVTRLNIEHNSHRTAQFRMLRREKQLIEKIDEDERKVKMLEKIASETQKYIDDHNGKFIIDIDDVEITDRKKAVAELAKLLELAEYEYSGTTIKFRDWDIFFEYEDRGINVLRVVLKKGTYRDSEVVRQEDSKVDNADRILKGMARRTNPSIMNNSNIPFYRNEIEANKNEIASIREHANDKFKKMDELEAATKELKEVEERLEALNKPDQPNDDGGEEPDFVQEARRRSRDDSDPTVRDSRTRRSNNREKVRDTKYERAAKNFANAVEDEVDSRYSPTGHAGSRPVSAHNPLFNLMMTFTNYAISVVSKIVLPLTNGTGKERAMVLGGFMIGTAIAYFLKALMRGEDPQEYIEKKMQNPARYAAELVVGSGLLGLYERPSRALLDTLMPRRGGIGSTGISQLLPPSVSVLNDWQLTGQALLKAAVTGRALTKGDIDRLYRVLVVGETTPMKALGMAAREMGADEMVGEKNRILRDQLRQVLDAIPRIKAEEGMNAEELKAYRKQRRLEAQAR